MGQSQVVIGKPVAINPGSGDVVMVVEQGLIDQALQQYGLTAMQVDKSRAILKSDSIYGMLQNTDFLNDGLGFNMRIIVVGLYCDMKRNANFIVNFSELFS